jgi:hypothetical protein
MSEYEITAVRLAFTCQLNKRNTLYSLRQNMCNNNNKICHKNINAFLNLQTMMLQCKVVYVSTFTMPQEN